MQNEGKKTRKKKHLIESYDDIYSPIAFILLIVFILGVIGTKYNQGYQIPSNNTMIIRKRERKQCDARISLKSKGVVYGSM